MASLESTTSQIPVAVPVANGAEPLVEAVATQTESNSAATPVGPAVSLDMLVEKQEFSAGEVVETMVGLHITAGEAPEDEGKRAPVDCVIVSDTSGSMQSGKLSLLKETISLLLGELANRDRVGLVTFSNTVKVPQGLSSGVVMDSAGRESTERVVKQFRAGGGTNLSGGLFAGIEQFQSAPLNAATEKELATSDTLSSSVQTCLLLTDGHANGGVRDQAGICRIMEEMMQANPGLSVHTFGYGADHNADLMRAISESGNGTYYFVKDNDDIRAAFGDCLGGVLSVVAQNLSVEIEAEGDTEITKVHHNSAACVIPGKKYTIAFSDLYGEEERDVLVGVKLAAQAQPSSDTQPVLRCSLKYVDVIKGSMATSESVVGVSRPATANPEQAVDRRIAMHRTRLEVVETLDRARREADTGSLEAARNRVMRMKAQTESVSRECGDIGSDLLQGLNDDLDDCMEDMRSTVAWRAEGTYKTAARAQSHAMQRCQETSASPADGGLRFNAYRTKKKGRAASKFMSSK